MLLGAIYEQDFHDFSHGFREGHSQHQALRELREQCMNMNIGWIADADVSGFFDNLDRGLLREFIKRRVNDGGILRLIGKWLNAGVLEGEILTYPEKGTPQGGVVSPMLSNIFLHYVLDEWFVRDVQPRMKGRCFLLRLPMFSSLAANWRKMSAGSWRSCRSALIALVWPFIQRRRRWLSSGSRALGGSWVKGTAHSTFSDLPTTGRNHVAVTG